MSHKNDGCKKTHGELNPANSKKRKVESSESCKQQSKAGSSCDAQDIWCACMQWSLINWRQPLIECRYTRPFPTLSSPSHYEIDTRTWQPNRTDNMLHKIDARTCQSQMQFKKTNSEQAIGFMLSPRLHNIAPRENEQGCIETGGTASSSTHPWVSSLERRQRFCGTPASTTASTIDACAACWSFRLRQPVTQCPLYLPRHEHSPIQIFGCIALMDVSFQEPPLDLADTVGWRSTTAHTPGHQSKSQCCAVFGAQKPSVPIGVVFPRHVDISSSPWHTAGLVATPFVDSLRSSWNVVASTLHRSRFNKTLVNHCCLHECRAWKFKKQCAGFLCVDPSTPRHHVDGDKMTNL